MAQRFQHWFTFSRREFADVSEGTCNATLAAFQDAYRASTDDIAIDLGVGKSSVFQLCHDHASCILSNSSEWNKSNLGTTNIVLGLLPTILAVIAPSMTELAVLGVHRPFLSSILSLSSPAVLQARVFSYDDPSEALHTEHSRKDIRYPLTFGPWSSRAATVAGVSGYVLALATLVNTLTLVMQLSNNSVISWGCTRTWPLYVWMFVPVVIHWLANAGYRMTLQKQEHHNESETEPGDVTQSFDKRPHQNESQIQAQSHTSGSESGRSLQPTLRQRIFNEISSCTSPGRSHFETQPRDAPGIKVRAGVLLNTIAGFLGFLHLIFATVTFSALLFIVPLDAIGQIAMRLMLSALVSRIIVMFEIAGLRSWLLEHEVGEKGL